MSAQEQTEAVEEAEAELDETTYAPVGRGQVLWLASVCTAALVNNAGRPPMTMIEVLLMDDDGKNPQTIQIGMTEAAEAALDWQLAKARFEREAVPCEDPKCLLHNWDSEEAKTVELGSPEGMPHAELTPDRPMPGQYL